ncbi:MAG: SLC13 family permease, partial [Succinivibrio sp.]
ASVLFMCLIGRHLLPQKSADGGLIAKSKGVKGSHRQRVTALVILIFVVLGLIIGIPGVSPAMISLTAAILCVLTGCITEKQAYKGIDWPTVFLFGGMLPVALAMQKTGAGEIIASFVSDIVGNAPSVYLIVSVIFLCSVLLSQFMPNTATASLLIPISMSIASKLNLSPYGVLITCAMGASCSFATPIATPCNTLVLRASNLHFKDYLKVGVPLIGIALLLCNLIVPKVWPL